MIYQDILASSALERYAADLNARARKCQAKGQLDAGDLRDRILASAGCCEWCGESLVAGPFELDHIISLKQGGGNVPSNLVVACPDCNRRKGQKDPARFAAEIYNSTGRRTVFTDRIFRIFALEPSEQLSFFAEEEQDQRQSAGIDNDDQPNYRW